MENEIRKEFERTGRQLAAPTGFTDNTRWDALSQYGYCLEDGFKTKESAEKYVLKYYSKRINLIKQWQD